MPPISLLIKPASGNCNLRCKYCFYHSLAENRAVPSYGVMQPGTLEAVVRNALEYADEVCTFAFQGGEPTLAGLDFFQQLIGFVHLYNTKKVKVNYALQTNGLLIDEPWAEFLHRHRFLVGISLDGTKEIHDLMRLDIHGKGTYQRVLKTTVLFDRYGVDYNILCVINTYIARSIRKVYGAFKKHGFRYLQFIPCLDPLGEAPGGYEHSLTPERYAMCLKNLFDLWYQDLIKGERVSIRYFENLVGMLMGYPPESCGMSGECQTAFVIEGDGGVYPCDFYVFDEWHMGNVSDSSFFELKKSEASCRFTRLSQYVDPKCGKCKWFKLCRGGCRREREPFMGNLPALNRFCGSYEEFFSYSYERLLQLGRMFSANNGGINI